MGEIGFGGKELILGAFFSFNKPLGWKKFLFNGEKLRDWKLPRGGGGGGKHWGLYFFSPKTNFNLIGFFFFFFPWSGGSEGGNKKTFGSG